MAEAEAFSLNYMIILTFLIMKKCNMFVGGSGNKVQDTIKGSAVSSVVHDCRAEERVNNAHVIYVKS